MRVRPMLLALAALVVSANGAVPGPNWDRTSAATKAICARSGVPRPPAADRPTAAQAAALKGCSSERFYYGEGGKPDYARARLCAFEESRRGGDATFGGDTILMQLYANGLGVRRDRDLATAYACRIDDAPAATDSRIADLQARAAKPGTFDYCDYASGRANMAECAALGSRQAAARRAATLAALVARMPSAARTLYPAVKTRLDAFAQARGANEVDQSGTIGSADAIGMVDATRDRFATNVERLVSAHWPAASARDVRSSDAMLNASYRRAMTNAYRDAFLRFAAPFFGTTHAAAATRLNRLRTAELGHLGEEDHSGPP